MQLQTNMDIFWGIVIVVSIVGILTIYATYSGKYAKEEE